LRAISIFSHLLRRSDVKVAFVLDMGSASRARLVKKERGRKRSGLARKSKKKKVESPKIVKKKDSEDDDDEPRGKKSKSKKLKSTDQLMETEDDEVVDLSAAHGAISPAQVRSKSKKRTDAASSRAREPVTKPAKEPVLKENKEEDAGPSR
jgi:hypothetical protein